MADEKNQSLVKYEPKPLAVVNRFELYAEKKRYELEQALERGQVADPFSSTILLTMALSFAASAATSLITTLLTPKQHRVEERGRRTGDLVINSELGILIPEVYFGAGADGYGGSWVPAIVGWTSGIRKHVSTTTSTAGGGKFGGRGATTETRSITYDLDWLLIWANKGPYRVLRSKANADVIFDLFGAVSSYEGESASSYTAPYQIVAYEHASGGNEVTLQGGAGTSNGGIVQWTTVQSNGAATRQLSIYYRTSSNTVPIELTINGGAPSAITLPATNEVYLAHTVPVALNNGVNTVKIQNKSPTFNLGIDKIYCFPGHAVTTTGTGILDPTIPADETYDPLAPPNPATGYTRPTLRWDGEPDTEPTGGQTGIINHGGNAQFAIYPGNTTQLTDPTYEAAIDAQHGAGSTPAYRGRCYEVDHGFFLSRWGGMVPNRTALLEHETIKNKAQFDAFMCSRVGIDAADHNFTALVPIKPRGLRIMGSRFEAREPMQAAEIPFDVVYYEQDGVLVGKLKYPFVSVATLTDKDFGWNDDEEASDGPLSLIDVIEPNETDLPRRVDVKYVDLDRDGEPGLQGYGRQITVGEDSVTLDLSWTFTKEEAQELAQKEVYRRHIEKPCRYFLSWEHLWINVGDVFTATLTDGFTYTILHAKDSGGLGVRQCEGILLDEPLFTQSAVADPYSYEQPIVPLPAMTVMSLLDTPLLRDGDITNNDGVGWYWVPTPRTGTDQTWHGAILVMFKNGEWQTKADTGLPGTVGTVVSVSDLYPDPDVVDIVFTADASTNVFTSVDNQLADGDEVTVVNTGGALPAPLVAGTSYFIRDKSGNTFKLAATSGGAAIDITTNGTGTNAINVGKIVVDLYGTTQTLSSVTTADILGGANLALAGNMVFNFATATQVAGFPNRWTLRTLLTGQRETEHQTASVAAGNRFVLIDEAVKFVPMEIDDLNVSRNYRAVTAGQSLDDAATIPAVWAGNALRARKVSDVTLATDGSNDTLVQFIGHPRPSEEPETYTVEVWANTSRVGTPLGTLLVTDGSSHAALLVGDTSAPQYSEGGGADLITFPNADKNNLIPANDGNGLTIESLSDTWTRFDFSFHGRGTEGVDDVADTVLVAAGLIPRVSTDPPYLFQPRISFTANSTTDVITSTAGQLANGHEVKVHNVGGALPSPLVQGTSYYIRDLSGSTYKLAATPGGAAIDLTTNGTGTNYISNVPLSVEWTRGGGYSGLPGTVTETWRSFGIQLSGGRTNVSVGYSRSGPRYTLGTFGSEYRGYLDYVPTGGVKPRCIVSGPSTGFPYPLRLALHASAPGMDLLEEIRDVMLGGNLGQNTILSDKNKTKWDLTAPFTVDSGTDIFTSTMSQLVDGDTLRFTNSGGALPAPLVAGTSYFVRDKSGNTFKLAATLGGVAIDITTNGTGTNYIHRIHLRIYQNGIVDGFPVDIDL